MTKYKHKQVQQIFEVRYERGYRYLDRCGETMLALEESLEQLTGALWMPAEAKPTGARLVCPDLDTVIAFDTTRLVVDQTPGERPQFSNIAEEAYAVVKTQLVLQTIVRYGSRNVYRVARDSVSDARTLAVKFSAKPFPKIADEWKLKDTDLNCTFHKDEDRGMRVVLKAAQSVNAPVQIPSDQLEAHPRTLSKGQRKAFLDYIDRKKRREQDPSAWVVVDLDCFHMRPGMRIEEFLQDAGASHSEFLEKIVRPNQ